jgi:hypothetical protein
MICLNHDLIAAVRVAAIEVMMGDIDNAEVMALLEQISPNSNAVNYEAQVLTRPRINLVEFRQKSSKFEPFLSKFTVLRFGCVKIYAL